MRREENDPQELATYIARMQNIAERLRVLGISILMLTVINFVVAFGTAVRAMNVFIALQLSALAVVTIVILAVIFEQVKRRGEIIYEEVTDELHRFHSDVGMEKPTIAFRIALRNFATSMDLPLLPGRYGVSLYISLNLAVLASAFVAFRTF